jgi:phosphopantetheine adenylyltransferase
MDKGLDGKFIHYGVREEDMSLIKGVCESMDIDYEWVMKILGRYHEKRVQSEFISDQEVEKLIKEALSEMGD